MNLWIFDNDGTLYDDSGARKQFNQLLSAYAKNQLGIHPGSLSDLMARLQSKHETRSSVVAFAREYSIPIECLIQQTYGLIDLAAAQIATEEHLSETLEQIGGTKIVFTNSPSQYALRVLRHLGISHHFQNIFGMLEIECQLKPLLHGYQLVQKAYPDFKQSFFVDDKVGNLEGGGKMGWSCMLYDPHGLNQSQETRLKSLMDLRTIAQEVEVLNGDL